MAQGEEFFSYEVPKGFYGVFFGEGGFFDFLFKKSRSYLRNFPLKGRSAHLLFGPFFPFDRPLFSDILQ